MRITIERDKCCSSGNCVRRAPLVFDQDDDGIVILLETELSEQTADDARAAADLCPTSAIHTTS